MSDPEKWFRFDDVRYAPPLDEWGDSGGPGILEVKLREFSVVRHTPKGVWIDRAWSRSKTRTDGLRFVLRDATKRFACPTVEEARESFIARKKRQAGIYEARAKQARDAIRIVNEKGVLGL